MLTNANGPPFCAFVVLLLLLVALQRYARWRSEAPMVRGGVLIRVHAAPNLLRGVDGRLAVRCPRAAQTLLARYADQRLRALMFREGSVWNVVYGASVALAADNAERPTDLGIAQDVPLPPDPTEVYYLRTGAPLLLLNTRGETDAPTPPGYEATPNAAVSAVGEVLAVQRFTDPARAAEAVNERGGFGLILYNGPNDPAYYAVQTRTQNPLTVHPGLPGTVFTRKRPDG